MYSITLNQSIFVFIVFGVTLITHDASTNAIVSNIRYFLVWLNHIAAVI